MQSVVPEHGKALSGELILVVTLYGVINRTGMTGSIPVRSINWRKDGKVYRCDWHASFGDIAFGKGFVRPVERLVALLEAACGRS